MKKKDVYVHPVGTAEFVVAHAKRQRSKDKQLSMGYKHERNPTRALQLAKAEIAGHRNFVGTIAYSKLTESHEQ